MSYKTNLQENNILLQSILETAKALPEANSGDTSIETGVLTPVTSLAAPESTNYYIDLENIPNIESKRLIVLCYFISNFYNPTWILTRNDLTEQFSLSLSSGNASVIGEISIGGYVFEITDATVTLSELTYYAI